MVCYENNNRMINRTHSTDSTELVSVDAKTFLSTDDNASVSSSSSCDSVLSSSLRSSSSSSSSSASLSSATTNSSNTCRKRRSTPAAAAAIYPTQPIQSSQIVAMDCEMVGVGVDGLESALARVTITDYNNKVLLDQYVQPDQEITDYRTYVSGITPADLQRDSVVDLTTCQQKVIELLRGKVLVGHGLANDLQVLGIPTLLPWYMIRDTALYEPYMKMKQFVTAGTDIVGGTYLCPRKLKDLCAELLQREIQVLGQAHSSYEDAVAALDLYKLVQSKWECSVRYQLMKTAVQMEEEQYKLQKYQQKIKQQQQQKKQQKQQKKKAQQQQQQLQEVQQHKPSTTKSSNPAQSNKNSKPKQQKKKQSGAKMLNKNEQRQPVELYFHQQQHEQQYYYMQHHSVATS